jgi:hypothetical protein
VHDSPSFILNDNSLQQLNLSNLFKYDAGGVLRLSGSGGGGPAYDESFLNLKPTVTNELKNNMEDECEDYSCNTEEFNDDAPEK